MVLFLFIPVSYTHLLGYTRATMAVTKRSKPVKASKPQKGCLSSDCSLQLDSHGVTGGVYKTRERILRSILICDH